MDISHIIRGQRTKNSTVFTMKGKLNTLSLNLPRFTSVEEDRLYKALEEARVPPKNERRNLVKLLGEYKPSSPEVNRSYCLMTGKPVSWFNQQLESGKEMVRRFAELDLDLTDNLGKSFYVSIPDNDLREYFFFLSLALMSGSPSVLKPSSGEPVLLHDIFEYLTKNSDQVGEFINLIYGNTANKEDSTRLWKIMKNIDLPIIMGDTKIVRNQITFNEAYSRALVLDADAATPHIMDSILSPLSCLVARNYIIVGHEQFEKFREALVSAYQSLTSGDLLSEGTTLGFIPDNILNETAKRIAFSQYMDSVRVHYPRFQPRITGEAIRNGAVFEHFVCDQFLDPEPLFYLQDPQLYLTGIIQVDSIEEARNYLQESQRLMFESSQGRNKRFMRLGVYGSADNELLESLDPMTYEINVNSPMTKVYDFNHQGQDLIGILKGGNGK